VPIFLSLVLFSLTAATPAPHDPAPFQHVVEAAVHTALAQHLTPGLAIAVVRDGTIVYERGFGIAGPAGRRVTPSTRFPIGSLSKQFTATAVLLSARSHKLSLDASLARYIPTLPDARLITISELLNQTSGLHPYPNLKEHPWPMSGAIAPAQIFAILKTDSSDFEPGTQFEYSNSNYAALAEIIDQANATSYADFLSAHLFGPLEMRDSGSGFAAQLPDDAAPTDTNGTTWIKPTERISLDLFYGAGSIVSSAHDMALWNAALLSDSFLDPATRRLLWEPGRLADGSYTSYAMGFIPTGMNMHDEVWHNGYAPDAGGYCYSALFPKDRLGIIVLTNSGDEKVESVSRSIVRDVLESYFPPSTVVDDPVASAKIRLLVKQLRTMSVDRSQLTPDFNKQLNLLQLLLAWPYFHGLGDPTALLLQERRAHGAAILYRYRGTFANGSTHDVLLQLEDGRVSGFVVRP
jgi:D-alanyl-D-alanine carboxypeptidase